MTTQIRKMFTVYQIVTAISSKMNTLCSTRVAGKILVVFINRATHWTRLTFDPSEVKIGRMFKGQFHVCYISSVDFRKLFHTPWSI